MYTFHYFDGTEVKIGDIVIGPNSRHGRVEEILEPESRESKIFACPSGGVLFIFDWDGKQSALLMPPPDGEYWEDIKFLNRKLE